MEIIQKILAAALEKIHEFFIDPNFETEIKITLPNGKINCHYCSNLLFSLRKNLRENFEEPLKKALLENELISEVEFVNGYLNLKMSGKFFAQLTNELAIGGILPDIGHGMKTNVEYCSINPTGFLHIGHARNAILGDSIARILKKVNFDVTKEYYVNDAGNQVKILAESIFSRILEARGLESTFPEGGYIGPEMMEIAQKIIAENFIDLDKLENSDFHAEFKKKIGDYAVKYFMDNIKQDLSDLNIVIDVYSSEKMITIEGYAEKAIDIMRAKGYVYEGVRDNKKAEKGKTSDEKLLLLKTTLFGDDEDRPLKKSDGNWTYLAPDIGYHMNKIERGFEYLICVLGADHDSYARRIKIAVKALDENIRHQIPLCQMVSFESEGKNVKFSKRLGNSIRTKDFIQEVDVDVLRFMMLAKTALTPFSFDYESATTMSMKNPVFYIQYAHARACSILRNSQIPPKLTEAEIFKTANFQEVLVILSNFQNVVTEAANQLTPHTIANYAHKVAESFHRLWQVGKMDFTQRFIIDENEKETAARLFFIQAYLRILRECLEMLGVKAPESMQ